MSVPVTIVDEGGIPVTPVESSAPSLMSVQSGGTPVTLASNGAPFVISGHNPTPPGPMGPLDYANSDLNAFTNFSRTYDLASSSAVLGLVCYFEGDPVISIAHGGEPLTIVRVEKFGGMLSLIAAGTGLTVESAQLTVQATGGSLHGGAIRINEMLNIEAGISGWVEGDAAKVKSINLPAATGTDGGVIKAACGTSAYALRSRPVLSGCSTVWSGYLVSGEDPGVDVSPSAPWDLGDGWSWDGDDLVHTGAPQGIALLTFPKTPSSRYAGGGANLVTIEDGGYCIVDVYDGGNGVAGPYSGPLFNTVNGGFQYLKFTGRGEVRIEGIRLAINGLGVAWLFGSAPAVDGTVIGYTSSATGPDVALTAAEILGADHA